MKLKASKICASRGHDWEHKTDEKDRCTRCGRRKHKAYTPNREARFRRDENGKD